MFDGPWGGFLGLILFALLTIIGHKYSDGPKQLTAEEREEKEKRRIREEEDRKILESEFKKKIIREYKQKKKSKKKKKNIKYSEFHCHFIGTENTLRVLLKTKIK